LPKTFGYVDSIEYLADLVFYTSGGKWNSTFEGVVNRPVLEMKDDVIECLGARLAYRRGFNRIRDE